MTFRSLVGSALIALSLALPAAAQEQTIVKPFAGSTMVTKQYSVDFDALGYLSKIQGETIETAEIEGQLRSALYSWPAGKSPIEIRRSFTKALEAAGFEILVNADLPQFSPQQNALKALQEKNRVGRRGFGLAVQQVTIFPGHYISATRKKDGQQTLFTMTMSSNQPLYMMEEATTAAMEEGTVAISADALNSGIEEAGKAILYGVQFDTGSAVLRPSSAASLQTIADVLKSRDGQFYIVGHTDDTGAFDLNMGLSAKRAASVVEALVKSYGIDPARLQAAGVGPLSPVASNANEAGRALNRRVELVVQVAD